MVDTVDVPVVTIDTFVARERVPYINILKMDLQGYEMLALLGAKDTLTEEVIDLIFTEVWLDATYNGAPLYWQIAQYLADFKYKTWRIDTTEYPHDAEGRWGDAIFISNRYEKSLSRGSRR
jgi:hypothetical protein